MLIQAPATSRSGYGDHARDVISSFMDLDEYDIKIMDVRWGDCPRNALDKDSDKAMLDLILPAGPVELPGQPDVYVDIRIPNEFQQLGKINIGVTAGIETTAVSQKWLEGCNKMDLIIVPSEHSKAGFINSGYKVEQTLPNGQKQEIGDIKLEKPMESVFEGVHTDIWKSLSEEDIDVGIKDTINELVKEDFAFLLVGQWVKGGFGEDRKDIGRTIKIFYETFANMDNAPALVLKSSGATFSVIDYEATAGKIKGIKQQFINNGITKLPNVYLLHGDLTKQELNSLYNHPKIKCMVSFTHGEGFGRPLLEASMAGLPVVASGWSGQLDFLNGEKCILVPGSLNKVPQSAVWKDIIEPHSEWFTVDEEKAARALGVVYDNYDDVKEKAISLMEENRKKFSFDAMTKKIKEVFQIHNKLFESPELTKLNLPKLKKVDVPSIPKVEKPSVAQVTE